MPQLYRNPEFTQPHLAAAQLLEIKQVSLGETSRGSLFLYCPADRWLGIWGDHLQWRVKVKHTCTRTHATQNQTDNRKKKIKEIFYIRGMKMNKRLGSLVSDPKQGLLLRKPCFLCVCVMLSGRCITLSAFKLS